MWHCPAFQTARTVHPGREVQNRNNSRGVRVLSTARRKWRVWRRPQGQGSRSAALQGAQREETGWRVTLTVASGGIVIVLVCFCSIIKILVQVLPENNLQDSLYDCRSMSLDRWRMLPANEKNSPAAALLSKERLYSKQYHIPYSAWPSWVHRSYDLHLVAHRVRSELQKSIFLKQGINVPKDPVELSYWIIQNLPLEDYHRLKLLNINNPCQRLRAELSILEMVSSLVVKLSIE